MVGSSTSSGAGTPVAARPASRPGRPRSARANEAILEAAIDELVEHGFASMTIERIAARAGVARSTVYRRWSSTTQLCIEALNHIRDPIPAPPGVSLREDLIFLMRHVRQMLSDTRLGRIIPELASEARRHPDLARHYWTTYVSPGGSYFGQALRDAIGRGELAAGVDVELIIDLLTGAAFKRALWQFTLTDEEIAQLVDLVLAGLIPPGSARRTS